MTILFCGAAIRFPVMTFPYGVSQSHAQDTSHSVRILWISDQPDAETADSTQQSQQTNIHTPGGI